MGSGRLPEYVHSVHKPTNAYRVLAAVVAALPFLGLFYLSGLVWSKQLVTNASDVVAAQRPTLGKPATSGAISLAAAGSYGTSSNSCQAVIKFMPPPKTRQDIALFLQHEGFEVGAQLGVKDGVFAAETLFVWGSCKRYFLVDAYNQQHQQPKQEEVPVGSAAGASGNDAHKQSNKQQQVESPAEVRQQAHENLQTWQHKLTWLNTTTTDAAALIKEPLDYIYLAAHKDYCSVLQALHEWWPFLKPGGIMAGHSYENAVDVLRQSGQDWSRCPDGTTVHQGAVQAAVNEFFEQQGLQIVVTYRESAWNTWVVRKPYYPCSSHEQAGADVAMEREGQLTELLSKMLQQEPQQQQQQEQQQQQQQHDDEVRGDAVHQLSVPEDQILLVPAASQQQDEQQQQHQQEDTEVGDDTFQPHQPHDTASVKGLQDSHLMPATTQQSDSDEQNVADSPLAPVIRQQPLQQQKQQPQQELQRQPLQQSQLHKGPGDTHQSINSGHQQQQEGSGLHQQEHQQLGAALQKLHDGDGLATTRAQQIAKQVTAEHSSSSNPRDDEVFGDILSTDVDQHAA